MSPTAYDVLGYEPEDIIGKPSNRVISPDDQADMTDFRKESYKNDHIASQVAVRLTRKDGVELSCVVFGSLCYDFGLAIITVLDPGAETCKSDQWRGVGLPVLHHHFFGGVTLFQD
jgi:PAS domain S-box-containing protein